MSAYPDTGIIYHGAMSIYTDLGDSHRTATTVCFEIGFEYRGFLCIHSCFRVSSQSSIGNHSKMKIREITLPTAF